MSSLAMANKTVTKKILAWQLTFPFRLEQNFLL